MTQWIEQSTTALITLGPFVGDTDGVTVVTTAQTSAADIAEIMVQATTAVIAITTDNTFTAITNGGGFYKLLLTSANTSTLGLMDIIMTDASEFLPIIARFMVVPTNVWDAYMGSDKLQVHITEMDTDVIGPTIIASDTITSDTIATDAITAEKIKTAAITALAIATDAIGATQIASDAITAEAIAADAIGASQLATDAIGPTQIASDAITAEAIATDAITATKIASDAFIDEAFATSATVKIADATWDEVLTGATHNINTSAGKRLRELEQAFVQASGTIATVTNSHTITLDTAAVGTADFYPHSRLSILEGTGAGQSRLIINYTSGRVCTLESDFTTDPDTSSLYAIEAADANVAVASNWLAQGFVATFTNSTTITLDALAEANADLYNGSIIFFHDGTGSGQSRLITAYTVGRVVTLAPALDTDLAAGTTYAIQAVIPTAEIVDQVWDEAISGHVTQGTYGERFSEIISGTVDTATNGHTPLITEFQADDITEATADHFNGRIVVFTTGVLAGQATDITDYVAVGGIGQFTVTALTEAPSNNDEFLIF